MVALDFASIIRGLSLHVCPTVLRLRVGVSAQIPRQRFSDHWDPREGTKMELYGRILRLRQVQERVGLSRSQIYALMQIGRFPKSISLGARAVGWLEAEIEAWIRDRALNRELRETKVSKLSGPLNLASAKFQKVENSSRLNSERRSTKPLASSAIDAAQTERRTVSS